MPETRGSIKHPLPSKVASLIVGDCGFAVVVYGCTFLQINVPGVLEEDMITLPVSPYVM